MQKFPDGAVAEETARAGIFGKVLRITGKVGLSFFVLLVVGVIVAYNYVMRPAFLEPLIVKEFAANTNGKIELKIAQASLLRGFKLRNIVVHPPEGFKETPILKAGEINLLYNVYGFFRGKFGVHEIAF